MAAAKKKAAKAPPPREKLFKVWKTADRSLQVSLVAEPNDIDLSVENADSEEYVQLAVSVEQIDELMHILATAKGTILRYERGDQIASDEIDEAEEEDEIDEEEEVDFEGNEEDDVDDEDEEDSDEENQD